MSRDDREAVAEALYLLAILAVLAGGAWWGWT